MPDAQLKHIDRLIREGKGEEAVALVRELLAGDLPRKSLVAAASLAGRVNLAEPALKVLNPIVRPEPRSSLVATHEERAEYANCLTKIDADEEALAILATVPVKQYPRAAYFQATVHMKSWDYSTALPLLKWYLETKLPEYDALVGKVSLAAVLSYLGRWKPASFLLNQLIHETGVRGHAVLHGTCLELAAYNSVMQLRFEEAERLLGQANDFLEKSRLPAALFTRKWQAISHFIQNPGIETVEALAAVCREAIAVGHFETVRDCERFRAVFTQDEALLWHIYFGTPFDSFRERLLADFDWKGKPLDRYVWAMGGEQDAREVDLSSGKVDRKKALKPSPSVHRLFSALCSDFYRPFRLPQLFSAVFAGEPYHPEHAPPRVHLVMRHLREWFDQCKIPLKVASYNGLYYLEPTAPCRIRLTSRPTAIDTQSLQLRILREVVGVEPFAIGKARKALGVSDRSALQVLKKGMENEVVEKSRTGKRDTRYRFVK